MEPSAPARALLDELVPDPGTAALLLDFDGTLAPIVSRPGDARLLDGAAALIASLRDHLGLVAFISGRQLSDLTQRVDVAGLAYAGNHGMEVQHAGGAPALAAEAAAWRGVLDAFIAGQDDGASGSHGTWVEDKGATLSVHWRTSDDPEASRRWLLDVREPAATAAGLNVTWGRMVMEVRPPAELHKGTAARELLEAAGCRRAVHVGDDLTDADAWDTLHTMRDAGELAVGAGIAAVGPGTAPGLVERADATVDGPAGALACLRYLDGALRRVQENGSPA